jgi:GntR family transcriptional regulator / MocR family aminotransferase
VARRTAGGTDILLDIDPDSPVALHRQLYQSVREAILCGRLSAGSRLPSTRTLAVDLGLSRNTVLTAFDQLGAEGFLEGRSGAGTRVSRSLPKTPASVGGRVRSVSARRPRSRRAGVLASIPRRASQHSDPLPRAFRPGLPALDEFPVDLWGRLRARRWKHSGGDLLDYGDIAGFGPLREAVATYASASRGVRCDAGQVLIVSGSQQALDLAARVLLDPGDAALVENPGYHGARGALTAAQVRLVPVAVDAEGMNVEAGIAECAEARLIQVSPSHQFPLGVTMSLSRRLALLQWASRAGAWVLEDDYDSEFRYDSRPLAALQGLDGDGRVIYVGTFSKVLFPSLRLGYLIVPPDLVDAFLSARLFADSHSPLLDQAVLADFISEGYFERHVRRMRVIYHERQETLVDATGRELAGLLEAAPTQAGMHLIGWLPPGVDDVHASRAAASQGVDAIPLSFFGTVASGRGGLVLGYAGASPQEIRVGAARLALALRPLVERTRQG